MRDAGQWFASFRPYRVRKAMVSGPGRRRCLQPAGIRLSPDLSVAVPRIVDGVISRRITPATPARVRRQCPSAAEFPLASCPDNTRLI